MPPYDTLPPYTLPQDSIAAFVKVPCAFDTVFRPMDHPEPLPRKSLFTHHLLPVRNPQEITVRHDNTSGWYLGGIALSLLLLCVFMRVKQLRLSGILLSAFNYRTLDRVVRESNLTSPSSQWIIAPIVLLPIAIVGQYLMWPAYSVGESLLNFVIIYAGSCLFYLIRNTIIRFLGNAFLNQESVHAYLTSNYLYHLLYGIVITALSFFVCYTDRGNHVFVTILAVTVGILFVMRLVRGMQLILTISKTPKLYLFYYLCTLELLPIIVLIKGVTSF